MPKYWPMSLSPRRGHTAGRRSDISTRPARATTSSRCAIPRSPHQQFRRALLKSTRSWSAHERAASACPFMHTTTARTSRRSPTPLVPPAVEAASFDRACRGLYVMRRPSLDKERPVTGSTFRVGMTLRAALAMALMALVVGVAGSRAPGGGGGGGGVISPSAGGGGGGGANAPAPSAPVVSTPPV